MVPAILALILSLYNYYIARKGAVLKITPGHRFGFVPFQSGRKLLYFPLNIMNVGTSIGRIDFVKYEFLNPDKLITGIYLKRRVGTSTVPTNELSEKSLVTFFPTLPIFCPPSEGISELFEFYDDNPEEKMLRIDVEYNCSITIKYDGKKSLKHSFLFKITEQEWNQAGNNIKWLDFKN